VQDTDLLQTIAEIAITLAGFTGVVAFLGDRARGKWRAVDLLRFNNLLNNSIAALLFSFTPILLFKLGTSEPTAWRCSSGFLAAYILIAALRSVREVPRLPDHQRVEISPPVLTAILFILTAVVALLAANAMGVAYVGESGPVIVALVWLLAFSMFQFVRLLLTLKSRDEGAV
jgi:hypothetical protein